MHPRTMLGAGLAVLVAACAPQADVSRYAQGDPAAARTLLARAAVDGPVRLEIRGTPPAGLDWGQITEAAASGARTLNARFSTDPALATRAIPVLVLAFGAPEGSAALGSLCRPADGFPGNGPQTRVAAAFCDSVGAVAALDGTAVSTAPEDLRRLVTTLTTRMFPDDVSGYGGYGWGGSGVSLGGWWGSSGGSGIGVGVGF